MRSIGYLADEASARAFADFLYVQGIDNNLEHDRNTGWAIWIKDEDRIPVATEHLNAFRADPTNPKFRKSEAAEAKREEAASDQADYEKKIRNRRQLFRPLTTYGFGPLTFVLIAISVGVFLLSRFGNSPQAVMPLFITDYIIDDGAISFFKSLPEIRHGQVWRLFTPMFIHFGILHIVFNMMWLRDLGSMIEGRQSSLQLGILVLVISGCSNVAQFYLSGPAANFFVGCSPSFGGMSGVVYGLLGYIWIRGKRDPASGLYLHPSTVTMMIVWFFLCYTGFVGNVANTAHAVGLVMGMVWGYLSSLRHR